MDIKQAKEILKRSVEGRLPTFLWGPPGVGKSSVVKQVAEEAGLECIDIRALLLEPVDLRGIPSIDKSTGSVRWNPPAFLPREGRGILFLDELNAAPPSVQAACYQLVLDRRVGEYELPPDWVVIGAGNRQGDGGVVYKMPTPLVSRFYHIEIEPDLDSFIEWAWKNNIRTEIIAFLRFRPELLIKVVPGQTFPCPRTWEMASLAMDAGLPVAGAVGEGAALEFEAFLDVWTELPDIQEIKMNPESARVPNSLNSSIAVITALVRNCKSDEFTIFIKYLERFKRELQVMGVSDFYNAHPEVKKEREYVDWIVKNKDVLV